MAVVSMRIDGVRNGFLSVISMDYYHQYIAIEFAVVVQLQVRSFHDSIRLLLSVLMWLVSVLLGSAPATNPFYRDSDATIGKICSGFWFCCCRL